MSRDALRCAAEHLRTYSTRVASCKGGLWTPDAHRELRGAQIPGGVAAADADRNRAAMRERAADARRYTQLEQDALAGGKALEHATQSERRRGGATRLGARAHD